jgi:O-acetyl-ADP-ribose deacetylase (regulator of RNase III)
VLTPGGDLPARYVIHTVGPVYSGNPEVPRLLAACHANSLALAREHALRTVAFPAISTGIYGYPLEAAASIANLIQLADVLGLLAEDPLVVLFVFGGRFALRLAATHADEKNQRKSEEWHAGHQMIPPKECGPGETQGRYIKSNRRSTARQ